MTQLIRTNGVFSQGWNDPDELPANQYGMILDVVAAGESPVAKLRYWRKQYYDQLPQFYSMSEAEFARVAKWLGVATDRYREACHFWPSELTEEMFDRMCEALQVPMVSLVEVPHEKAGSYAIRLRREFWFEESGGNRVWAAVLHPYERVLQLDDLVHKDEIAALDHGLILVEWLCTADRVSMDFFEERFQNALRALSGRALDWSKCLFRFDGTLPFDERQQAFARIRGEHADSLRVMREIIASFAHKPFDVVRL